MNDNEREQWVMNEESLYRAQLRSRQSMRAFIRTNRADIDAFIRHISNPPTPTERWRPF